jgi:hypothetical protein
MIDFDKNCKLTKLVRTKEDTRYCTNLVRVDSVEKKVVATNGAALVVIDAPNMSEDTTSGFIRMETFKRQTANINLVKGRAQLAPDYFPELESDAPFVDYNQVIRGVDNKEYAVLSPKLLLNTLAALGVCAGSDSNTVEIHFPKEHGSPVTIKHGKNIGVIMPLKE